MKFIDDIINKIIDNRLNETNKTITLLVDRVARLELSSSDVRAQVDAIASDTSVEDMHVVMRDEIDDRAARQDKLFTGKFDAMWNEVTKVWEKYKESESRVGGIKDTLNNMNRTVASMSYSDLEKYIKNLQIVYEGGIDDKIVGLYKSVDEKIASRNGNSRGVATLLKRIASLEDIKEKADTRKPTTEVILRRDELKEKLLAIDRSDHDYGRYDDAVTLLNWVLGE